MRSMRVPDNNNDNDDPHRTEMDALEDRLRQSLGNDMRLLKQDLLAALATERQERERIQQRLTEYLDGRNQQ
jgi:hypothetical protein